MMDMTDNGGCRIRCVVNEGGLRRKRGALGDIVMNLEIELLEGVNVVNDSSLVALWLQGKVYCGDHL